MELNSDILISAGPASPATKRHVTANFVRFLVYATQVGLSVRWVGPDLSTDAATELDLCPEPSEPDLQTILPVSNRAC